MTASQPGFGALLRRRCPRCRDGAVFAGLVRMHAACPTCGLEYFREPGYFFGAMYFSYALGVASVTPLAVTGFLLGWPVATIGWACTAQLVVLAPWLFQYSRVIWLWFDQRFDAR